MYEAKLSSKNQIVIPKDAREALGARPGGRLLVVVRGDMVILLGKPRKYSQATAGMGKGLYGSTYLSEERKSWR